ncbi:MAG: hypothetical protein A2511_17110 [Deltaproteobacteria bacterium RIFOXYD12_FULL_50_9]|nr:MAG: hypothetical protein A2511_17110 [Deltaproteobacteria bacterium RIFOXYD12_FULL_50_9]
MKKLLATGIALLPIFWIAGAQAGDDMSGQVKVTGKSIKVDGNKAKFSEYGDPDSGVTGGVELKYDAEAGYVNLKADEIARDTQNLKIEAGQYGKSKLDASYNQIQHNFNFDAKTFYTGVGTNNLTAAPYTSTAQVTASNVSNWTTFDYAISRDQYGANLKLDMLKPFFANFSVSKEERKGIKATASYLTNVVIELPEPVDYTTNTFQAEVGYGQDPFFFSLAYLKSNFENANPYLYVTSLAAGNISEFITLPPDNDYSKVAFKGRVKMPMSSALAVNVAKSTAESEVNLNSTYNNNGTTRTNTLSDNIFNGKVDTFLYGLVLTSSPLDFIDTKLFYSSYDKANKSDSINSIGSAGTSFTNHLFDYEKTSYGLEAGLKLPAQMKLTPYYKHINVERHRGDLPETDDDIYGLDLKWSGLEWLTAKLGYERMDRKSDWQQLLTILTPSNQTSLNAIEPYIRRFDAGSQGRDTYKLALDFSPTDKLNLGLAFKHKQSDYNETVYGVLKQTNNNVNFSADLTVNERLSLSGYLDYEIEKIDQTQRRLSSVTPTNVNPDVLAVDSSNYTWTADQKNKTLDYGVAATLVWIPNTLTLRAQFDKVKSDGFADYTYYAGLSGGFTNDTVDSENWDDYTKDSIMLKATYTATKSLTLIGGYAYEH